MIFNAEAYALEFCFFVNVYEFLLLKTFQNLFDQVIVFMHLHFSGLKNFINLLGDEIRVALALQFLTLTFIANLRLAMRASYFAWLFEAFHSNFTDY